MDPQSIAFQPQTDSWRYQNELIRLQQVQADHADRLLRLERRQEDDTRMKSVWGGTSPFPSVLGGTPQQTPLQQPSSEHFKDFDDEPTNMINSLHLDADDGPRRVGATSRAASVRFDESANHGHWTHASRSSLDLLPRGNSGLGGLAMSERTSSHKSEGRASSVHSVRSVTSGRANSLNMETGYSLGGDSNRSPIDAPGLAPGLLILGSVPAIIRCWMNTNFKHDTLLYAAVCSGSHKSFLEMRLVEKLGFEDRINTDDTGVQSVELPVYFPEAVPHPASSRSSSPAPQLPSLTVVFIVTRQAIGVEDAKGIQIILGSDVLRAHNADIFFSSNSMSLFDDDRNKLSIPLVRPEDSETFSCLQTVAGPMEAPAGIEKVRKPASRATPNLDGLGQSAQGSSDQLSSAAPGSPSGKYRSPGATAEEGEGAETGISEKDDSTSSRPGSRNAMLSGGGAEPPSRLAEAKDASSEGSPQIGTPVRTGSSPAIWSNWRREGVSPAQNSQFDWANTGKSREPNYQRRDTGIKVLKPMRTSTRTFSAATGTTSATPSPADGKSRFFEEGKRRSTFESGAPDQKGTNTAAPDIVPIAAKENQDTSASAPRTRANPAGGASAFAWLNQGGSR